MMQKQKNCLENLHLLILNKLHIFIRHTYDSENRGQKDI